MVYQVLVLLGLFFAFNLAGCSTISNGLNAAGESFLSVGEGLQKTTSNVTVEEIAPEQFELSQTFYEPPKSLDSWAMRLEARNVCPDGFVYSNRNARSSNAFSHSDAQCVSGSNCAYKLEWRIECQDVPTEPFSFFGKS